MKKIVLFSVILFAFFGCKNTPKKDNSNGMKTVKVGYLNMVSSLTHFVAVEKGYYKEQNLNVKANVVKTSNLIAQEIVSGHINFGIELAIIPVLKQLEKSPNTIQIFSTSTISVENGFDAIVVSENSKISDLKDLSGKKIGGFPGTTAKVSFLQLFQTKYPDLKPPTFIQLTPNLHIQSLLTGEIDALFAYEPVLSTGIVEHKFKKIFPSVYGTQFEQNPIGVGAVNQKWFAENQDTAKAFLKAIDKALDFIKANPIEAKKILAKATKIKPSIAQNMNILPLSKSDNINLQNLDNYLALLKDLGEIKATPKAKDICIKQD